MFMEENFKNKVITPFTMVPGTPTQPSNDIQEEWTKISHKKDKNNKAP